MYLILCWLSHVKAKRIVHINVHSVLDLKYYNRQNVRRKFNEH